MNGSPAKKFSIWEKIKGAGLSVEARSMLLDSVEHLGVKKYRPYLSTFNVTLSDRTWPANQITKAPIWCSVDLRDGNQALINPMNVSQKLEMFQLLCEIGFKEIEIGFPSASETEFEFARTLIEKGLIPKDVTPQVLVQARAHLISRTFEALEGTPRAIVHLYNSTSELQRRVVFRTGKDEIKDIAVKGVEQIKELALKSKIDVTLEYSPESFTGTELDYAVEVCDAVIAAWEPTPKRKIIINLPATVEMATPNVYADQIELFCRKVSKRDSVILSLHTHNDRGTGVAATELGLLAGADRVEGTLFGNGERTGNVDIVTLALNLYSQGIEPKLDLFDLNRIREVSERLTQLKVHERHPYAGDLVFTAFSGSHQDAINKGLKALVDSGSALWEVPYLPIDPRDVGRTYEAVIRINSQSGKGGVAYIMQNEFGCDLPKDMHPEFSSVIQKLSEETGAEVPPSRVWDAFVSEYLERDAPYKMKKFISSTSTKDPDKVECTLTVEVNGAERVLRGEGNGPIDAARDALLSDGCVSFHLTNFSEHARSAGSDAEAISYIQVEKDGEPRFRRYGVGISPSIEKASIIALVSAVNRIS